MKTLAYCVGFLLLLNPIVVLAVMILFSGYIVPPELASLSFVVCAALSLMWTAAWMQIRKCNPKLDWECRRRMGW